MLLCVIGWVEVEEGIGRIEAGNELLKVLLLDDHLLEPFRGCFHLLQISQWHVFIALHDAEVLGSRTVAAGQLELEADRPFKLGSGLMLHEVVEHLPGDQIVVQFRNESFRVVLDVLPEVYQIAIDIVIDLGVSALLGQLPVFLVGTFPEQYPGSTTKDFTVDVMLGDERQYLLAEESLATYPGDDAVHDIPLISLVLAWMGRSARCAMRLVSP